MTASHRPAPRGMLALAQLAPVLATAAVFTPLAPIAYPAVPVAALAVSALLVVRRRFVAAIELTVWCWLLAALARRVVELRLGYQPTNLVLLTPVLASLPLALALVWVRRPLPRTVGQGLGAVVAALTIGAVLALTQLPPVATVAGASAWLPPLVLGLAVLLLPADRDTLLRSVWRIGVVGCLVVGGYGVAQWVLAPPWDSAWILSVADVASAFGRAEPGEIRVFSTLNSPGPAANALLLLVVLASLAPVRPPLKLLAVGLGVAALGLTQVRQVYVAGVVFLVVALVRRVYPVVTVAAAVAVLVVVVAVVPAAQETVGERVETSLRAGDADASLNARLTFQAAQFGAALVRPVGLGLGSTGSGVRASGGAGGAFADVDSGYLELVLSLGLAAAALLLTGVFLLLRQLARARVDRLAVALFCLSVTLPLQLLLGNVFTGPVGAVTWFALMLGVRLAASEPGARWVGGSTGRDPVSLPGRAGVPAGPRRER